MSENECAPIAEAVAKLAGESATREIWLIGSRANGSASETSDWDLLVFSYEEPVPVTRRHSHVDVLRVGPSGHVLLEGQPEEFTLQFTDFQWSVVSEGLASYIGKKAIDFQEGEPKNYDAPRFVRVPLKAVLLWSVAAGPPTT